MSREDSDEALWEAHLLPTDFQSIAKKGVGNFLGLGKLSRLVHDLLMQAVPDSTGREDLVKALREALLLSAAKKAGATRLARGDSINRLAARVIACSAKGAGFALPSTLHFLDARYTMDLPGVVGVQRVLSGCLILPILIHYVEYSSVSCHDFSIIQKCWWLTAMF